MFVKKPVGCRCSVLAKRHMNAAPRHTSLNPLRHRNSIRDHGDAGPCERLPPKSSGDRNKKGTRRDAACSANQAATVNQLLESCAACLFAAELSGLPRGCARVLIG